MFTNRCCCRCCCRANPSPEVLSSIGLPPRQILPTLSNPHPSFSSEMQLRLLVVVECEFKEQLNRCFTHPLIFSTISSTAANPIGLLLIPRFTFSSSSGLEAGALSKFTLSKPSLICWGPNSHICRKAFPTSWIVPGLKSSLQSSKIHLFVQRLSTVAYNRFKMSKACMYNIF